MSISEEITFLKIRLASLNGKIEEHESYREIEEGSSSARFSTQFTDIDKLYKERERVKVQLRTLEASTWK
ncbi:MULTISPECIES: hypothetical protein [unclassified Brevundimonas]|jgi:hypothetical protein|uniref:hypothetical protein n=1 Tax=unclassified Brevundimonas TaxID=2622653 RepID=UPI003B5886A4